VTIPRHTMGSHANAIQPRYVPSTPTITARHLIIAKPRDLFCSPMVIATPVINFMSTSPDVKVIDALDVI